jgi:tetratricopeptide (TPR) repeat protein
MKTKQRFLVAFAAALVILSSTGCNKLKARDHLNKGVQAYKNSKFEQAIDHFQQAVALDPSLINARLYLATAYAQQYIPGAETPENNHNGEQAIDQYKHWPRSTTRKLRRPIPTTPSLITRSPSSTGRRPTCRVRKSAPNSA